MKIEIWHNILWSRYKAQVFSKLYVLFDKSEHEVSFFQFAETSTERQSLAPVDTTVHKYPYTLLFKGGYSEIPIIKLFGSVVKRAFSSESDIVVLAGYDRPEHWLQLLIYKILGKKIGVFCDSTAYDNPNIKYKAILKSFFFKRCAVIFCYGIRAADYVASFGASHDRIVHRCQAASLPDSYDQNQIPEKRKMARKAARLAPRFLYVGRLSPEKRLDTLLEAFRQFAFQIDDAELILVGSGPQLDELKSLADSLGIRDRVAFMGGRSGDDLFNEYLQATALILPSFSEPWGLVVNEALAYACPVIVSHKCGCVPELVKEGKTGYVFECDNIPDLIGKMHSILPLSANIDEVTRDCLSTIAPFSPENAAMQIYQGVTNRQAIYGFR